MNDKIIKKRKLRNTAARVSEALFIRVLKLPKIKIRVVLE